MELRASHMLDKLPHPQLPGTIFKTALNYTNRRGQSWAKKTEWGTQIIFIVWPVIFSLKTLLILVYAGKGALKIRISAWCVSAHL
jgi:hypothetical protein